MAKRIRKIMTLCLIASISMGGIIQSDLAMAAGQVSERYERRETHEGKEYNQKVFYNGVYSEKEYDDAGDVKVFKNKPEVSFDVAMSNNSNQLEFKNLDGYKVCENFAYVEDSGSIIILKYLGNETTVEVPSDIEGTKVISIGGVAFSDNRTIKEVIIPEGVEYIQGYAFFGSGVEDITLPSTIKEIEGSALSDCLIKTINLGAEVQALNSSFNYCRYLEEINVDEDNEYYSSEEGILFNKDKSTLISYPINKKGESYNIKEGTEYINKAAFKECKNLKSLKINKELKVIGPVAVSGTNLEKIDFSEASNLIIKESAFTWNKNLKEIDIKGVSYIGGYSFRECGLTSVSFDKNIEIIDYEAFNSCVGLEEIKIYNPNVKIADDALWLVRGTDLEEARKIIKFLEEDDSKDIPENKDEEIKDEDSVFIEEDDNKDTTEDTEDIDDGMTDDDNNIIDSDEIDIKVEGSNELDTFDKASMIKILGISIMSTLSVIFFKKKNISK